MKKQHIIFTLFIIGFLTLFTYIALGERKKLINSNNGFTVIEFYTSGRVEIYDPVLRERLVEEGIFIPSATRDLFNGQERIFLSDALFQKAFINHYSKQTFSQSVYSWEKS